MNNVCLWKFYWDCGSRGALESLFKATKKEVEDSIGKNVSFGEVLGKHSYIESVLESKDIEFVTDDADVISKIPQIGYNPLDYVEYECSACKAACYSDEMNDKKTICTYCEKMEGQNNGEK